VHSKTDWARGVTSIKARDFLRVIEVGKVGKLGEDDELDGAELLRDALSPPLALTPNRHPLRGYSARRRQERGLSTLPRLLPSPRSEGEGPGMGGYLQPLLDSTPIPPFRAKRIPQTKREQTMTRGEAWRGEMWEAIGRALAAHAVMLRDAAIVDDSIAASLLTAIDAARRGAPPVVSGSLALVAAFDERVDSLIAAGATGAVRIARARHDVAATAQRLVLRNRALELASAVDTSRGAVIDLAESHVFTLMPVWSGSSPLQPTNFAHFLTGALAPLGRSAGTLQAVYENLDRSPLGAAALAGPGLPVDRDETSDLLGSEGPVESTFDAISSVDHLVAAGDAAAASVTPVRRLVSELMLWLRTEPQALRLADELLAAPDANLPHFRPPALLERLVADARQVESDAAAISSLTRDIPYGPVGELADGAAEIAGSALSRAAVTNETFAMVVAGPIEINRAWLARTAGQALITAGDLADFFMAEEALDPAAAREIAALTTGRARQEGLEASAITPAMIDAAALLVIGRELGIEIERLGAYLAPRRFIEKRTVLGGPAAPAVRENLALERNRLEVDRRWLEEKRRRITLAEENLEIRTREILDAASG
jgi:argininosuccinate lyase